MIETSIVIAVIVGVVEVIKQAFNLPTRLAPLVSLVLGVIAFGFLDSFTAQTIFTGLIAGLSASGLYSGVKANLQ